MSTSAPQPAARPAAAASGSVVEMLRTRGPVFGEIGRFLALQPDTFQRWEWEGLLELGTTARAPTPPPVVREVLNAALGRDTAAEVATLEAAPVLSGTLTQVHRGQLRDGTSVLVKIVRPEARAAVAEAVAGLEALARDLPAGALDGVVDWLDRQLDLGWELANLDRLGRLAAGSPWEAVPRPIAGLCSATSLVTAGSEGIPVADLLVATGAAPAAADRRRLAAIGVDLERLARILVAVNLRQAFRYRFLQADLRPANLVALPGEIVSFADYGFVGESDQGLAAEQLAYLIAVYDNDVERMVDAPCEAYSEQSRSELGGLRRDLLDVIRAREASRGDEPPGGGSPAAFLVQVLARARARGVDLPPPARMLYRSVVLADEVARRLDPRGDPATVARDYLRVAQLDAKVRTLQPDRLESTLLSVSALARDSPAQLQKVLSDLADETFSLDVRVLEVPHLERNRNRRARMIAAAVASVSVALLLTAADLPTLAGVSAAWPLAILLALVYAWLLLEWRRLR